MLDFPENGVRIRLTRGEHDDARATYDVRFFDARHIEYRATAQLVVDGGVIELSDAEIETGEGPALTDELKTFATALLKGVLRSRKKGPAWPRHIQRWRG